MLPLRDYLSQRRAEAQAQIKALRAEIVEIDAAFAAIASSSGVRQIAKEKGTVGSGKKTLKELALEALSDKWDGLEASGILAWIKLKYGIEVARESMSPQLSRLGQEGRVVRDGLIWRISSDDAALGATSLVDEEVFGDEHAIIKDETPGAQTPGVSGSEEDDEILF